MHILQRCQSSKGLPLPGDHLNPVKNRVVVLPGRVGGCNSEHPFHSTGIPLLPVHFRH